MSALVNFALYQSGWFACVAGAARGVPALGAGVAVLLVAVQVLLSARPAAALRLIGIAALLGAAWDSGLIGLHLVRYPNGLLAPGLAPYWIVALWMLFATTFHSSLAWLQQRLGLAAVLGAVGGPLAYWGAARLGAVQLLQLPLALAVLCCGWALITPLLAALARPTAARAEVA